MQHSLPLRFAPRLCPHSQLPVCTWYRRTLTLIPCPHPDNVCFPTPTLPAPALHSINGMTLSVEVLSAGCCALDPPHHALGPAVARLRSLEFRGWSPLVVPFHEWAALAAEEGPAALALTAEPDGAAKRAAALLAAAAARQRYLLRKMEEVVGEQINPDELRRTQKMPRRRLA